jgi:hypothetical protein
MSGSGSEIKHSVIQTFRITEKTFHMPETWFLILTQILNYSGGPSLNSIVTTLLIFNGMITTIYDITNFEIIQKFK